MKKCSKCKENKSLYEFYNDARNKDGKYSWCKICRYVYKANIYYDNVDIMREKANDYYARNSDSCKKSSVAWQKANPDKMKNIRAATRHKRRALLHGCIEESATNWEIEQLKLEAKTCGICGQNFDLHRHRKTIEHIKPINMGGSSALFNLMVTGLSCNAARPTNGSDMSSLFANARTE